MYEEHKPVVPECEGCIKIDGNICTAYINPAVRHRLCECPLKTTKRLETLKDGKSRKKTNPIKASKRKNR